MLIELNKLWHIKHSGKWGDVGSTVVGKMRITSINDPKNIGDVLTNIIFITVKPKRHQQNDRKPSNLRKTIILHEMKSAATRFRGLYDKFLHLCYIWEHVDSTADRRWCFGSEEYGSWNGSQPENIGVSQTTGEHGMGQNSKKQLMDVLDFWNYTNTWDLHTY